MARSERKYAGARIVHKYAAMLHRITQRLAGCELVLACRPDRAPERRPGAGQVVGGKR